MSLTIEKASEAYLMFTESQCFVSLSKYVELGFYIFRIHLDCPDEQNFQIRMLMMKEGGDDSYVVPWNETYPWGHE